MRDVEGRNAAPEVVSRTPATFGCGCRVVGHPIVVGIAHCPTHAARGRQDGAYGSEEAKMHVRFVDVNNGPERLICEAELVFNDGPLAGLKLVGFSLWSAPDGVVYVTFPSRAFGAGGERRYFDYLRSEDGVPATVRRVKDWIIDEYRAARAQ